METDRVDVSAKGWDEKAATELHASQTDHKRGFGGKFGVEEDRHDQVSALSDIRHIITLSAVPYLTHLILRNWCK